MFASKLRKSYSGVYSKKGRVFEAQTIRRYARSGSHNLTPVRKEWLLDSWGRTPRQTQYE
jgi:hypothetical protein